MKPHPSKFYSADSTVITATNRLAHEQQQLANDTRLAQGEKTWRRDCILPYSTWVAHLWHAQRQDYALLEPPQLLKVAENVLVKIHDFPGTKNANHALWDAKSASRLLLEAWNLCHEWRIDLAALQTFADNDHALFTTWARQFNKTLEQQQWLGLGQLPCRFTAPQLQALAATKLTMLGFDFLTPSQNHLLAQLQSQGGTVDIPPSHPFINGQQSRHCFASEPDEWNAIAKWALAKVQQSPCARIAIICPDISAVQDLAVQALEDQLRLKNSIAAHCNANDEKPYHLSLGTALSATALGQSALLHLSLLSRLPFQDLNDWLISPLNQAVSDGELGAKLSLKLRSRLPYELDLFTLIHALDSKAADSKAADSKAADSKAADSAAVDSAATGGEAKLKAVLTAVLTLKKQTTGKRGYRQWADFFRQVLRLLAWPKPRLSSHEHQVLESWHACLEQFAALDVVSEPIYLAEALANIRRLCEQITYQDSANPKVQIHVMSVLEAAELDFTAVWLAGFHENVWPPKPQTNPFIPLNIQREHHIPQASPAVFLENVQAKTQQLLNMAAETIVSHADNIADLAVAASPLIASIALRETAIAPLNVYGLIHAQHADLETIEDASGIPFASDSAKGGAGLIAAQAACPFQAYARYRLFAQPESSPEPGTDHRIHGILIHEILQVFWAETKTQAQLKALLDADQLADKLQSLIPPAIAKRNRSSGLKQQFDDAQARRIKTLLLEWLSLEAARPPFSVRHCEQRVEYPLAGLNLHFIIDRIDQLEGRAACAVIDYKSGSKNTENDWCGDRLSSPQLPLYALAVAAQMANAPSSNINPGFDEIGNGKIGNLGALAYGQINAKSTAMLGLSASDEVLPDLQPPENYSKSSTVRKDLVSWDSLLPLWQTRLEKLATAFLNGDAAVDPKNTNRDCRHCAFTPFCRIKEQTAGKSAHPEQAAAYL